MVRRRRAQADAATAGDFDLSLLRKPINLGLKGALQVAQCIQSGTPEVRSLLIHECELLYECRVCRSMYRSLANLIAHKRVYCTESYGELRLHFVDERREEETVVVRPETPPPQEMNDEDQEENVDGREFEEYTSRSKNKRGSKQTEEVEADFPMANQVTEKSGQTDDTGKSSVNEDAVEASSPSALSAEAPSQTDPPAHDSSVIQQMLQGEFEGKSKEFQFYTQAVERTQRKEETRQLSQLHLQPVPGTTNAVFQRVSAGNATEAAPALESSSNDRKRRRKQIHQVRQCDEAMDEEREAKRQRLDIDSEIVIVTPQVCTDDIPSNLRHSSQIIKQLKRRKDCDLHSLTCLSCSLSFSITKNLYRHMTMVHSEDKRIYPCIYCKSEYGLFWNLCRHITVKHKKSKIQLDRIKDLLKTRSYIRQSTDRKSSSQSRKSSSRRVNSPSRSHQFSSQNQQSVSQVASSAPKAGADSSSSSSYCSPDSKPMETEQKERVIQGKLTPEKLTAVKLEIVPCKPVACKASEVGSELKPPPSQSDKLLLPRARQSNEVARESEPKRPHSQTNNKPLPPRVKQALEIDWDSMVCPRCKKTFWKKKSLRTHRCSRKAKSSIAIRANKKFPRRNEEAKNRGKPDQKEEKKRNDTVNDYATSITLKERRVSMDGKGQAESRTGTPESLNPAIVRVSNSVSSRSKRSSSSEQNEAMIADPVRDASAECMSVINAVDDTSPLRQDVQRQKSVETIQLRGMVDESKLECLKCNQKYTTLSNLHQHCIRHLGWKRYKCRLCVYTSYNYSEIAVHLRRVHLPQVSGNIIHRYIHDLETDKLHLSPLKTAQKPLVSSRTSHELSTHSSDVTRRIKPEIDLSNIQRIQTESFNISTRNSPRKFDTSPYRPVDQMSVMSTRSGYTYKKPEPKSHADSDSSSEDDDDGTESDRSGSQSSGQHSVASRDSRASTNVSKVEPRRVTRSRSSSPAILPSASHGSKSVATVKTSAKSSSINTGCSPHTSVKMQDVKLKPASVSKGLVVRTVAGKSLAEKTRLLLQSSHTAPKSLKIPANQPEPTNTTILSLKDDQIPETPGVHGQVQVMKNTTMPSQDTVSKDWTISEHIKTDKRMSMKIDTICKDSTIPHQDVGTKPTTDVLAKEDLHRETNKALPASSCGQTAEDLHCSLENAEASPQAMSSPDRDLVVVVVSNTSQMTPVPLESRSSAIKPSIGTKSCPLSNTIREGASTPEKQSKSAHQATSAPEKQSSSAYQATSAPEKQSSSAHQATLAPEKQSSSAHQAISTPEKQSSSAHQAISTPEKQSKSAHQATSAPEKQSSSAYQATSAPEKQSSSAHQAISTPGKQAAGTLSSQGRECHTSQLAQPVEAKHSNRTQKSDSTQKSESDTVPNCDIVNQHKSDYLTVSEEKSDEQEVKAESEVIKKAEVIKIEQIKKDEELPVPSQEDESVPEDERKQSCDSVLESKVVPLTPDQTTERMQKCETAQPQPKLQASTQQEIKGTQLENPLCHGVKCDSVNENISESSGNLNMEPNSGPVGPVNKEAEKQADVCT